MRHKVLFATPLILLSMAAYAQTRLPQPWVPPPAPRIIEGTPITPAVEVFDGTNFILHFPKPEQADWRQTRYQVEIRRDDEEKFMATLSTRPFVRDDEVAFLTIQKDTANKYKIEVIDKGDYPYKKVWSGSLDMIKPIAE